MNAIPLCTAALLGLAGVSAASPSPSPQDPPAQQAGIPECKEMKKTASGLEYGAGTACGDDDAATSAPPSNRQAWRRL